MTSARHSLPFAVLLAAASAACAPATTDDIVQAAGSSVEISPPAPEVLPRGTVTFAATVGGAAVAVTWSIQEASGGSVTPGGLYTAPATAGQYHVVATTATSPAVSGSATVTVTAAPVVQVTITPRTPAVLTGGTVSFSAAVTGATSSAVTWTVSENSGCGSITSGGVYTAPGTPGTCHVVATSVEDPTKSDTASVTVNAPAALSVTVSPKTPSVVVGGQVTFTAVVANATNTAVTWTVAETSGCGAITSGGLYTAPGTAGTCHVVATSVESGARSDTATVTVTTAPADLAAQLAVLSGKAIYFGHQSVGGNIMTGVRTLLASNTGSEPRAVNTSAAASMGVGVWAEAGNGTNNDPAGKFSAFSATIEGGVGAKVDIALMKLCWVDFSGSSIWFSAGKTAAQLFASYQSTLSALKAAHPNVTFVHVTTPLYTPISTNARREEYNALMRSTYAGTEPVFDLALLESTDTNGQRCTDSSQVPALCSTYNNAADPGHLNAAGQDKVARALIAFLAALP